jgi:tetratricopeptide (TPR) repeat protein
MFRLSILFGIVAGLIVAGCLFALMRVRSERERAARAAITQAQNDLKLGRPARALKSIARVPEQGPWEAELLTVKGLAFASLGRPDAVRPLLERSLKIDPNQPMAAKVLAAVYFTANESDRGFAMLEKAAGLDGDDFRPWFAAGDALLRFHNDPAKAATAFRGALRRRPDHDESRIGLIDSLLALGSASEAWPLLETALRDHPGDARVLQLAARHARLTGQGDLMNHYAELALDLDPDDAEALVTRSEYLRRQGRTQEALGFAERAVKLAPNDLSALNILAQIQGAMGMTDRAAATSARHREARDRAERIAVLRQEIQKRPEDPEPRWRMGEIAAKGGMKTLAVNSFRAALALDPQCQPAQAGLAALNMPAVLRPVSLASPSSDH